MTEGRFPYIISPELVVLALEAADDARHGVELVFGDEARPAGVFYHRPPTFDPDTDQMLGSLDVLRPAIHLASAETDELMAEWLGDGVGASGAPAIVFRSSGEIVLTRGHFGDDD